MIGFGQEEYQFLPPEVDEHEMIHQFRGRGGLQARGMARAVVANRILKKTTEPISETQVGLDSGVFDSLTPKQRKALEIAMVTKLKEMGVNSKVRVKNVPEEGSLDAKETVVQNQLDEQDIKDRLHKIQTLPLKNANLTLWFESPSITSYEYGDLFGQEILDLQDVPTLEITTLKKLGIDWNNGKPAGLTVLGFSLDSKIRQKVAKEGYILSTGFFGEPTKTPINGSSSQSANSNWTFLSDSLVFCTTTSRVGVVHPQEQTCCVQVVSGSPNSKKVRTLSVALHQDLMVNLVQQTHADTVDGQALSLDQSAEKRLCAVISPVTSGVPSRFQTYHLPQTAANIDEQAIVGIVVSKHRDLKNHFRLGILVNYSDNTEPKSSNKIARLLLYQYVEGSLTYLGVAPIDKLFQEVSQLASLGLEQGKQARLIGYHDEGNLEWSLLELKLQSELSANQQEPLLSTNLQQESQLLRVNLYGTPKNQELPPI